ncbi:hypothetical protein [Candidatus Deianiraea vastatrix]|uniref:DUF5655 domain-containing protein n=1 Tax=Candidatus Deianiraea vastatrix TaxID=2163644 RepID=A0A5B8XDW3_9RICK|nr:hypothetical protein [Candidatus Deianiraea vastatrix]QED23453.1 hypothetical protein Deia_00661 [Candidatus Deianiraea vastatrix]
MQILNTISLKDKKISEINVQDIIKNDPSVLGFGKLVSKDFERITDFGRIDLILADNTDEDIEIRYIVEIQLGEMDTSHIIRAIEYWEDQRRKFPSIIHFPVIIAEKVTGRYFNVINLFRQHKIPISIIEINAFDISGQIGVNFNTIFGPQFENDDKDAIVVDRNFWQEKSNKENLILMDEIFVKLKSEITENIALKYNKNYIGITLNNTPFNFICFRPKKSFVKLQFCKIFTDEMKQFFQNNKVELVGYQEIRITKNHIENIDICNKIIDICKQNYNS